MAEWYRDDEDRRAGRYGSDWNREREYRDQDRRRGMFERGSDEVRSWFGDEEAERRRRMDETERGDRYGRGASGDWRDRGEGGEYRSGWRGRETDDRSWYGRGEERSGSFERERQYGRDAGGDWRRPGEPARDWRSSSHDFDRDFAPRREESSREFGTSRRESGEAGLTPLSWSYTEVWMVPGPHVGRGPKGYQRSDDRIREDLCERLSRHGQIDASDIDIEVANGEVTLRGTVDSREAKRRAEDVAESISGVREVRNELRTSGGVLSDRRAPAASTPAGQGDQTPTSQRTARMPT